MARSFSPALALLAKVISGQTPVAAIAAQDWPDLVDQAARHDLGPMLWWTVRQTAHRPPADLWAALESSVHAAASHHVLLETAQAAFQARLAAQDIPALWLKGIALAREVYSEPWLRPMSDLDVLVPYARRREALTLARSLGYHAPGGFEALYSPEETLALDLTHHYHLHGGPADVIMLEVHFRLLGADTALLPLSDLDWFWQRTAQDSGGYTVLQPEAHLLYLCAHALLQHGEAAIPARNFFDLHLLITRRPLDWACVVQRAAELGWTAAVERGLEVTQTLFATPIPADVPAELRRRRPAFEDATRVARLGAKGARWEKVRIMLAGRSPREKLDMARRIVLPSRAYMRQRYEVAPGKSVGRYYLVRWRDQAAEVAYALTGRLARRVASRARSGALSRVARKGRTFWHLPAAERRVALAALMWLPVAGVGLRALGFRRTQARLAALPHARGGLRPPCPDAVDEARVVARVVAQVAAATPIRAACLTRSLVVWRLLRARGLDPQLRIGAAPQGGSLNAHAWIELDGVVIGDPEDVRERFAAFDAAFDGAPKPER